MQPKPRHVQVHPKIWQDDRFHGLSTKGKVMVFQLCTTSLCRPWETPYGATLEELATERQAPLEHCVEGFEEARTQGLVDYAEDGGLILLPALLAWFSPTHPEPDA
jgi:hypothetical protein